MNTSVRLRRAAPTDVERRLALGYDPDICRMYGAGVDAIRPMTVEDAKNWVRGLQKHPHAWVVDHDGLIGEVRLDNVNLQDRRASFAIGILDPLKLGRGVGTEAAILALRHAFNDIGLHRVSLRVLASNARAIRSYEKCGFSIEGRERESAFIDGHWQDDLLMGVIDHEFELAMTKK